jgi:glyoxylase-like metal-dependent hydrolase (beta-lactamase superfamily II)
MKMHLLSGGRLNMRRSVYHPGAAREERIDLPVICALIRHAQGNVLFDTGCHPDTATDAAARWHGLEARMWPQFAADDTVIHQLPRVGLTADDIDVVVCSHLHTDHCGCNGFFRRATVIVHADELAAAQAEDAQAQGFFRADWDHGQPIETIAAPHDLFGDGTLTLLPAPGHTRGMTIAHVVLPASGAFVLASDAAPVAACLDQRYAPRNSWDADRTVATLDEIARLQADGATVVHGHDAAQWAAIRKGAEAFD